MTNRRTSTIILSLFAFLALGVVSMTTVNADDHTGQNIDLQHEVARDVSAFSICRQLTSHNANTVFVPIKTVNEWGSVVNNGIPNVDISTCGESAQVGCMTTGYDNYDATANEADVCTCDTNRHYDGAHCVTNTTVPHTGCRISGYDNADPTANIDGPCSCNAGRTFDNTDKICKTTPVTGCMTVGYDNYNENANVSGSCSCSGSTRIFDGTSCVTKPTGVHCGCQTSGYNNYDSSATCSTGFVCVCAAGTHFDSGQAKCVADPVYGCTNDEALNYKQSATVDDASCKYAVKGCMDARYDNYNSSATVGAACTCANGKHMDQRILACVTDVAGTPGCTQGGAYNLNINATIDDGSCRFHQAGCPTAGYDNYVQNSDISEPCECNAGRTYQNNVCTATGGTCVTAGYDNTGQPGSCGCNSGRHFNGTACVTDITYTGGGPETCTPDCGGYTCGESDGCGGVCGSPNSPSCFQDQQCNTTCSGPSYLSRDTCSCECTPFWHSDGNGGCEGDNFCDSYPDNPICQEPNLDLCQLNPNADGCPCPKPTDIRVGGECMIDCENHPDACHTYHTCDCESGPVDAADTQTCKDACGDEI